MEGQGRPTRHRRPAYIGSARCITSTYDHRSQRTEDPVRSPELKLRTGGLVVRWVTTCEYPLLYVLLFFCPIRARALVAVVGLASFFLLVHLTRTPLPGGHVRPRTLPGDDPDAVAGRVIHRNRRVCGRVSSQYHAMLVPTALRGPGRTPGATRT